MLTDQSVAANGNLTFTEWVRIMSKHRQRRERIIGNEVGHMMSCGKMSGLDIKRSNGIMGSLLVMCFHVGHDWS